MLFPAFGSRELLLPTVFFVLSLFSLYSVPCFFLVSLVLSIGVLHVFHFFVFFICFLYSWIKIICDFDSRFGTIPTLISDQGSLGWHVLDASIPFSNTIMLRCIRQISAFVLFRIWNCQFYSCSFEMCQTTGRSCCPTPNAFGERKTSTKVFPNFKLLTQGD